MKSLRDEICLAAGDEADLISSEAERRRFHPSLLGFHRARHDFIKQQGFALMKTKLCSTLKVKNENCNYRIQRFGKIHAG
jgi:hypothetical protein